MEKYRSLNYPPVVFWEVTDKCNHNCIHCFNYWRTDKEDCNEILLKSEEEYLEIGKRILQQKPVRVVFTGGEPMVVFDRLKPVLSLFHDNHINLSFNTNAALLTNEVAQFFSEKRIGMFVSFPSCNEQEFDRIVDSEGAYKRVLKALEFASEYGLYFSFNMVVSKINLYSIYDTAKFLKERFNISHFSITRVSTPINAIDQFDKYVLSEEDLHTYMIECVRVRRDLNISVSAASPITPCTIVNQDEFDLFALESGCEAGKTSYVISSSNEVRACARDFKTYGNFMNEEFSVIWERLSEWRDESFIPSECSNCEHKSRCRGGCRVDGIVKNGSRSCLDNYSDIKRLPIKFVKKPDYLPLWDYTTYFNVPESLQVVKETFGTRLAYRSGFTYCTDAFSNYLKSVKGFSVDDFCKKFDLDIDDAKAVLNRLYINNIIHI